MGDNQPLPPTRTPLTVWGRILLLLFFTNGLGGVAGGIGVMKELMPARTACLLAGLALTGWMIGELKLIGFQAPIQVWFVALGLLETGLSFTKLRRS
jgi:hypothetical protein